MKFKVSISGGMKGWKDRICKYFNVDLYNPKTDKNESLLLFGMFHYPVDFTTLESHRGIRMIFWCGSDIKRLIKNKERIEAIRRISLVQHFVENELEHQELKNVGIESNIRPSFLGDINNFPVSFKPSKNPQIFLSGHQSRQKEYGKYVVKRIAMEIPEFTFHWYGIQDENSENIIYHGFVPNEQMNEEIKNYQVALRCNEHDGFSEVLAKGILMGQACISRIKYPYMWNYTTENELVDLLKKVKGIKEPNIEGRNYYKKILNNFPWCPKI